MTAPTLIVYRHCHECGAEFEITHDGRHGWLADGVEPTEVDHGDIWWNVYHLRGNGWECEGSVVLRFEDGQVLGDA